LNYGAVTLMLLNTVLLVSTASEMAPGLSATATM